MIPDQGHLFDAPPPPAGSIELRDYQEEAVEKLRDGLRRGLKRQMLCSPTGSGKTICAAALMDLTAQKGNRVAFIADRITLVNQTSERLAEAGLQHGVAQGQNRWGYSAPIHVWSAQTMERAFQHRDVLEDYQLVIIDEAHTVRKVLMEHIVSTEIPTVGLSATPFTKGIGDIYQRLINVRTTDQLIEDKWLVPFKIFVGTKIDMRGAKTTGGEWRDSEVSSRTLPIIGDIVSEWREKTRQVFGANHNPKTLVFSASVASGREICAEFNGIGVGAEQISYRDTDDESRNRKINDFRFGDVDVLVSVDALSKGFDVPIVECIVMARPFRRSLAQVIQQLGRGMRIAPGKSDFALLLDHATNYVRFADRIESFWAHGLHTLHSTELDKHRQPAEKEDSERLCPECGFVWPKGARECPMCGYVPAPKSTDSVQSGTLREYQRRVDGVGDPWPHLCRLAEDRYDGDRPRARKMARIWFKNLTGSWPAWEREFTMATYCDARIRDAVREEQRKYFAKRAAIDKWRRGKEAS